GGAHPEHQPPEARRCGHQPYGASGTVRDVGGVGHRVSPSAWSSTTLSPRASDVCSSSPSLSRVSVGGATCSIAYINGPMMSIGSGNTTVEFWSAPSSRSVCRWGSCTAGGGSVGAGGE